MKEIPLSQGYTSIVDDEDYERVSTYKWYTMKSNEGRPYGMYDDYSGRRKSILLHRFIMRVEDRRLDIDHINHNTLDNRKENLRVCSRTRNLQNRFKTKNPKSSKYKGVCFNKRAKLYLSYITVFRKRKYLGYYRDEVDAAKAYDVAAREHFGEFAQTNFPTHS